MNISLGKVIAGLIAVVCFAPKISLAECDVQEVIEMVEDDSSTKMIKNACKESVDVPDCSLSTVIQLARKGDEEHEIYEQCMKSPDSGTEDEISGDAVDEFEPEQYGLPPGSTIQACGCWGYVDFGARDVAPQCASGYAEAVACPAYCPAGGYQWGIRCL
jgi:hypothetical protein